ncbi:MAG TPA: HDOD domain-containing protein [Pirellulales bacterium]|nr:HDOD domain-containing protein [Pirellulales bacterium]
MEVPSDTLAELLNHSRQLYTLPAVALEVLELANSPQVDTARVKACIERDPALTAKLLRVVNSSLFGLTRRVSSLNQALAVLGTKPLKMLVLGFGLPEPLFSGQAREVLNRYWRHTLTRAVAARELSERLWKMPGDELFVAGLLKDLGRLVLIQGLGRPYVEMLRKADWPRHEVRSLERRLIGFDHVQLTAGLLEQWGLPAGLVAAVQSPDTVEEVEDLPAEAKTSAQILFLAEQFAELLADEHVVALKDLLNVAGNRFTEQQLAPIAAMLDETVTQLADVLSLDLPRGLAYEEVLARAYLQLSLIASDAAAEVARVESVGSKLREFAAGEEARNVAAAAARFRAADAPHSQNAAGNTPRDAARAGDGATVATARRTAGTKTATASTIHPGLRAQISSAAIFCRQTRQELSLLLIEIDAYDDLIFIHGEQALDRARLELFDACRATESDGWSPLELSPAQLALVLPACDRPAAADVGHMLLRQARDHIGGGAVLTLSIGASTVAVPAKNFEPVEIVRSAERCVRAAQLSGGNCFKSIEAF